MARAGHSPQTSAVLAVLAEDGWHHGYDLAKRTGLKSGTLYPILVRLAERGLVEARWEEEQPAGRPRRHLYQLTAQGAAAAEEAAHEAAAQEAAHEAEPRRHTARRSRPAVAT